MPQIVLRWRGRCSRCHAEIPAGSQARFDTTTHELRCLECVLATRRVRPPSLEDHLQVQACIDEARRALRRAG